MHRRRSLIFAFTAVASILSGSVRDAAAAAPAASEYELKAVFLLHFSRFVHWPPDAFDAANAPLSICVLGDDPFGPALDEIVRGKMLDTHPIIVERHGYDEAVDRCHILFVSRSANPEQQHIFVPLHGKSILTVSDKERFARREA